MVLVPMRPATSLFSLLALQVQPTMAQFEMDTFAKSHDHMSNFWNACYDAMMSSSLRRERDKADSRKMFQVLLPPGLRDITMGLGSSSCGRGPKPKDVILWACSFPSPQGHAHHFGNVILEMCSSLQNVILGLCSLP